MMKTLVDVIGKSMGHWVGDGFPVRSLFSYQQDAEALSPFLLFDHAGPRNFEPHAGPPRGVGAHPHRGFETVTIVYDGEVSHRDSAGGGGTIGRGDVQWMTAGHGVVHEEFHSAGFSRSGGPFHVVQLWLNLPPEHKLAPPAYQAITADNIPVRSFERGIARIIAGEWGDTRGPARSFSPVNLWDVRLAADAEVTLPLPEGHTSMVAVLNGHVTIGGTGVGASEIARLTRDGEGVSIHADGEATLLVLTGAPVEGAVVGYGPFVMTSETEIREAIDDYNAGRCGAMAPA
ncbi:MAG: pirin family protein [Sphingomonadales bacterium]|nr:pirin family protein [Sphingomonadales bacterium]